MSRCVLDDNHEHAIKLLGWLEGAVNGAGEWREGGLEASARRQEAWERIERIANQLAEHAKHAGLAEECEPVGT